MTFFQNVFMTEIPLGDRLQQHPVKIRPNAGRGQDVVMTWADVPTFNLSGTDPDGVILNKNLTLTYAFDVDLKNWTSIVFDVSTTAASVAAVKASEIVSALNANTQFTGKFTASLSTFSVSGNQRVCIRQNWGIERFKFYVGNSGAETLLHFNGRAGVDELPSWFSRHTMANNQTYSDCLNFLIAMNTGVVTNQNIINAAVDFAGNSLGYNYSNAQADWQLCKGQSDLYKSQKITVDASSRITAIIEFSTGAKAGDLAKKTTYSYTGAKTNPDVMSEVPYVLASGDLITPP